MGKLKMASLHNIAASTKQCSVIDDLSPAFTIWHNGAPSASGSTLTAVTAATAGFVAGDDLHLTINGADDTRIGTGGKLDCSTTHYDGLLEIYNAVNALPGWCFRIEAGIGADLLDDAGGELNVQLLTLQDCFQKQITAYWDTSTAEYHHAVISNRRIVLMASDENKYDKIKLMEGEHGATNVLDYLKTKIDVTGTLIATFYSCNSRTQVDTLIGTRLLTDNTSQTLDFTKCGGITAKQGERLVIRLTAETTIDATIAEFVCMGRSIGGRLRT